MMYGVTVFLKCIRRFYEEKVKELDSLREASAKKKAW